MADRKSNTSHKPSLRSNLQGLSLTDFGTNFNFGPTLVPTSASPSALRNQPATPDVSSSTKATTAELETYAQGQEDSFLGQHPQKHAQAPQQSVAKSEGNPVGSAFFTMTSSAESHDDFLSRETSTQSLTDFQVSSSRAAGSNTPPRPSSNQPSELSSSPERPVIGGSLAASQSTGWAQSVSQPTSLPQTPPQPTTGWPQTPPRPTTGWPQTSPQPGTGLPQTLPQPVSSWSQNPSTTASLSSLGTDQPSSQFTYSQSPQQVPSGPIPSAVQNASIEPSKPHWFYCKVGNNWIPFSYIDSDCLEQALRMPATNGDRTVPTDGGRYDVNLDKRLRYPLYWEESVSVVRRCTWFCKGDGKAKLVPYMEDMAQRLEAEFQVAFRENKWPRRLDLKEGEHIIMHNTNVMVHFCPPNENESWSGEDIVARPKVVRRGIADIEDEIEDGEPAQIDHLVFVVHGIGPIADLNFRDIIECVDDLRKKSLQMLFDHHEELSKGRAIGRVEFLPVQWHSRLHNDSTGVDKRLQSISLGSIHRLREFTNSTLLDILFYTSPTYCQTIVNTVGDEIKRLLGIFKKRNPMFNGQYSVCGHSLGSSILFDILLHQKDPRVSSPSTKQISETPQTKAPSDAKPEKGVSSIPVTGEESSQRSDDEEDGSCPLLSDALTHLGLPEYVGVFEAEEMDMETFLVCSEDDIKEMGIPMGPRKKLIGYMAKQKKIMEKKKLEREERRQARAAAKAIARAEQQEKELKSTTENAPKSSEPELTSSTMLMKSDLGIHKSVTSLASVESVEVVYQQGLAGTGQPYVEYPQLDLNLYALFALGSPIGMFLTVRGVDEIGLNFQLPTCPRLFNIFHPFDPVAYRIEPLVNQAVTEDPVLMPHHKGRKRMHIELRENLSRLGANLKQSLIESARKTWESIHEFARAHSTPASTEQDTVVEEASEAEEESSQEPLVNHVQVGKLNGGQRIDYVLQEKPIESLNEYLFALSSHVCYWVSEDTALFMLKEIYRK